MSISKVQGGYQVRFRTEGGRAGGSRKKKFPKLADARRFEAEVMTAQAKGLYVDQTAGRITLAQFAEGWMASRIDRASTSARVSSDLKVHVLPLLGHRPLAAIRPSEVQQWVKGRSQVLEPGSVENVYRVLTGLLSAAVRDRLIGTSPAVGIVLPRKTKVEAIPPTIEEVGTLLAAMPDRHRIAGVLAAGVGLRQGEALGLTVDRIDFLRRQIRIDRQMVTPDRGEPHFGPVKNDASLRTVPLADAVLEALSGHLAAFPPGPDGLVVTYQDGRPVKRNRFGDMWRQTRGHAGLEFRYHDLAPPLRFGPHRRGVLGEGGPEGPGPCVGQGHPRHLRAPLARQ